MKKILFILFLFNSCFLKLFANETIQDSIISIQTERVSFLEALLEKDSLTGSFVVIHQDSLLNILINNGG